MIYFDNAATTAVKPPEVAEAVARAVNSFGGAGRGVHEASLDAGYAVMLGSRIVEGVGLILLFALIEVLRNILEPRIVGNQIGLHPIVTITAMYAGLKIAGFWGMLAAPVAVLLGRYLWTGAAPERRAEA